MLNKKKSKIENWTPKDKANLRIADYFWMAIMLLLSISILVWLYFAVRTASRVPVGKETWYPEGVGATEEFEEMLEEETKTKTLEYIPSISEVSSILPVYKFDENEDWVVLDIVDEEKVLIEIDGVWTWVSPFVEEIVDENL